MKKKILIIIVSVMVLLGLGAGGLFLMNSKDVEETKEINRLEVAWYDEKATEFTITTVDQLYELAALSEYYTFEDQTIKLGADLVINEGKAEEWLEEAPKKVWSPIANFSGTFDGQGHTISGLYARGYNAPMAMFIYTDSSCEIKDFRLVNSCFDVAGFDGGTASIASNGGGKIRKIYSDAIIDCEGNDCAGIMSNATAQTTIEECWYDGQITLTGRNAGGIVDAVLAQRTSVSHCLFTGEITTPWSHNGSRVGGICGMVINVGTTLAIRDCLSVGTVTATGNAYYAASVLGALHENNTFVTSDTYATIQLSSQPIGKGSKGKVEGYPIELYEKELTGTKAYAWTNLDFDNYWSLTSDSTPIPRCFATEEISTEGIKKAFDMSWYNSQEMLYVLTTPEQLYGLSMMSASNNFLGITIQLGADIVLNEGDASKWSKEAPEHMWYPVKKFAGTFDGQGHSIEGVYIYGSKECLGFFQETTVKSTIKNVSFKNSYIYNDSTATALTGSVAGRGNGIYDTIYSDAIVVGKGAGLGGLIGQINGKGENKVTNCWFDGRVTGLEKTGRYVGGIAGNAVQGSTIIEHCLNTGTISAERTGAAVYVGGIVSAVMNKDTVLQIKDCLNVGKIITKHDVCVGAVVGRHMTDSKLDISDTYATTESYKHPKTGFMGIGNQSLGTHTGEVV